MSHLLKYSFILILLVFCISVKGQSQEDFEGYGKAVFENLIKQGDFDTIIMLRLGEYRDFIREREEQKFRRDEMIRQVNAHYLDRNPEYFRSISRIRDSYREATAIGAEMDYLETLYWEKKDALRDTYTFSINFLYKHGKVHNEVKLKFDAVWYFNTFLLITAIEEDF